MSAHAPVERQTAPGSRFAVAPYAAGDLSARTDASSALERDALVLRAIAARLRDRPLPPTLRRLADLDAALIEQVAGNLESEYAR